ncbi:Atg14 domain-containing protein [[Flexibacter] sp. ATCC 35103]|uniref:Atg14 domain-containing protein n=1 Tax=[Flexibacter] sp. ATCC 35103 TaxID=1937528 RepID=UPI0021008EDE|nr:Atg14 domain-containing protein [[Flexibacter] sp. ATCC 35103]
MINTESHQDLLLMAFFLPMKKTLLLIALLVIGSVQAQEKISSKTKKFKIPVIKYSEFAALDNVLTQTAFYQMDKSLQEEESNLKKDFFNIDGFIKDPVNGKLKFYLTYAMPRYTDTNIDSTYNKKENKWTYSAHSNYLTSVKLDVKYGDKILLTKDFGGSESYSMSVGNSLGAMKIAASEHDKKVRTAVKDSDYSDVGLGFDNVMYKAAIRIQDFLNYKFGYSTDQSKEKFEFVTSKGHSEYKQMFAFETEITAQMEKITLEKGLDEKLLAPHLQYLESLLVKYPLSPVNEDIRFIVTNNLAETYFLLENKEKALLYANLLIENDKQDSRGSAIVERVNRANFADKKIRSHTTRFADLKKLGLKIAEEKEELRLAFFEKIDRQEADWVVEKENRTAALEKSKIQRENILDSIAYQSNPDLLAKIIANLGGSEVLKKVEKTHLLSKLTLEDSNIPQTEERWATTTNYLLKKKMPEAYYEIVNGPEAWSHSDRESGIEAKWAKLPMYTYNSLSTNLDPVNFLTALRLDLWNKLDLLGDEMIEGKLCYHLNYFEKTLNVSNRTIPKTDYHLFIDKENFSIVATERTEYDDGNKSFFERKLFKDYRPVATLNSGKIPYKINYEIEDFYGDTFYQENREKIEVNAVFGNRIFMKEVYFGGFK